MKRLTFLLLVLVLSLAACGSSSNGEDNNESKKDSKQQTSEYPKKNIEIVVPFAAGGGTDITARALANVVGRYLPNNQNVVVVNKPGGGATVGITDIYTAKPDGYTLGMVTSGGLSIQPNYGNTVYKHDSFQPVLRVLSTPQILLVNSDSEWETYEDWLKYVQDNPGKFTYGTPGAGNSAHIAMEGLQYEESIEMDHVPFDGTSPALTALMGNHIDGAVALAQEAKSQIDSGELRALANLGSTPVASYGDIPVLGELGINIDAEVYTGIIAPSEISDDVLEILVTAFKQAVKDPDFIEQLEKMGVESSIAEPDDFQKNITNSYNSSGEILKNLGLLD